MENVVVESFNVIGVAVKTKNEGNRGSNDIGLLWQKFVSENIIEKIPGKVDPTIYCIYTDYEGDFTEPYVALLGCKVENLDHIPEGMMGKHIAGGNYLKTTARGDLSKGIIGNEWGKIWSSDLNRAYAADFEVYGEKAQNFADAEIDFFISVK